MGANFGLGTIGPLRRQTCALKAKQLPKIDLVLLSHAHLDHFDIPSLSNLPGSPTAVTAKNTSDLLSDTPIRKFTELKWGEKSVVHTDNGDAEVEAFQVRHSGYRWRHDTQRGYGATVSRGGKKVIFGGDTAICNGFKEIRNKGPFEFACMPIGAYKPWIMSHCNPEQALQMAIIRRGKIFPADASLYLSFWPRGLHRDEELRRRLARRHQIFRPRR